jgi:hypothetical protein
VPRVRLVRRPVRRGRTTRTKCGDSGIATALSAETPRARWGRWLVALPRLRSACLPASEHPSPPVGAADDRVPAVRHGPRAEE